MFNSPSLNSALILFRSKFPFNLKDLLKDDLLSSLFIYLDPSFLSESCLLPTIDKTSSSKSTETSSLERPGISASISILSE